jgi:hypothetical protein
MGIDNVWSIPYTGPTVNTTTSRLLRALFPAGTINGVRLKLEGDTASDDVVFNLYLNGVAMFTTELTIASGTDEIEVTGLSTASTNDTWGVLSIETIPDGALAGVTSIGLHVEFATTSVQLTGAQTVAGVKTFSSSPIVPTPSGSTDAANKAYVDSTVAGLSWKQAVRVATTADGTFASAYDNGSTVDGVTLATGDRILIKNQSDQTTNGIYIVAASGAPTRATDADSAAEILQASVYVQEGSTLADTQWVNTTNAPITLGATNIVFAQLSSGGASALDDLSDVVITAAASGEFIRHNGTNWVDGVIAAGDLPTGIDAAKIADGSVSNTEFQYIGGLTSDAQTQLTGKQATLVSGTNIKTINGASLLGSGDLVVSGGGGSGTFLIDDGTAAIAGTFTFDDGDAAS